MAFIKKLLLTITIVGTIAATAFGWIKLPKQVQEATLEAKEAKAEIKVVENNLDKYVQVNEEYKRQQMEQKALLIKFIEQVAQK